MFKISIVLFFLFIFIEDPMVFNREVIVSTSRTIGIFFTTIFLLVSIVEANIGRVAFLDPEIAMVPDSFFPPIISSFSIVL